VPFSVPATNRPMPSSWVMVNVPVLGGVNTNSNTVACANPPVLRVVAWHAALQFEGAVRPAVEKNPPIVSFVVSL
jgi:hypothetical protein